MPLARRRPSGFMRWETCPSSIRFQHKHSDGRRQISLFLLLYFRDQFCSPAGLLSCNLTEACPELIFETDAGFTTIDRNRSLAEHIAFAPSRWHASLTSQTTVSPFPLAGTSARTQFPLDVSQPYPRRFPVDRDDDRIPR